MQNFVKQRGMSLWSLIFFAAFAGVLFILGAKIVPTVLEWQAVHKAVHKAANEGNTKGEIRSVFTKAATINSINSIKAKDLEIIKNEQGKTIVKYSYERDIPLLGPAFLVMRYNGEGVQDGD